MEKKADWIMEVGVQTWAQRAGLGSADRSVALDTLALKGRTCPQAELLMAAQQEKALGPWGQPDLVGLRAG